MIARFCHGRGILDVFLLLACCLLVKDELDVKRSVLNIARNRRIETGDFIDQLD